MADESLSKEGIDERAWHAVASDEARALWASIPTRD
jgi:hypothetical protein